VLTAKMTGAKEKKYFQAAAENRANPSVDFGTPGAPATAAPGATPAPAAPAARP
jgi:hypothetical protein